MIMNSIATPTLLMDERIVRNNIQTMVQKARRLDVSLRPHFKTHQSGAIGQWFREAGVDTITVSSVKMARYFTASGWRRITIAFPLNLREMDAILDLSESCEPELIISDCETPGMIPQLGRPLTVWIEIDTGYHRSGLAFDRPDMVQKTIDAINTNPNIRLKGFLSHTGNTYHAEKPEEIKAAYQDAVRSMTSLKNHFQRPGQPLAISMGDTPSSSLLEDWGPIQEARPGNFVFYDLMQHHLGACRLTDIAVALACPVVAKYPERNEVVVYGGAVHLSKEYIETDGRKIYGRPVWVDNTGWQPMEGANWVVSLSQEHGILRLEPAILESLKVGDLVGILPVHSCLTAHLMKGYLTLDGQRIDHLEGIGPF